MNNQFTLTVTAQDDVTGSSHTTQAAFTVSVPFFGTNKGSWSSLTANMGSMLGYRGYNPPATNVPSSYPGNGASPIPAGVIQSTISLCPDIPSVLSGSLDSALVAYAKQIPPGTMITCWAEGERGGFTFTTSQIQQLHQHVYPIFKENSPNCLYGQIFTCFTSTKSSAHYPLATATDNRWVVPGLDFYGLDGYGGNNSDPAAIFGNAIDQVKFASDAPIAISETNSSVQSYRPAWFTKAWEFAKEINALTFYAFFTASSTDQYFYSPSDTSTIGILQGINTESKL